MASQYEHKGGGGGSSSLAGLTDVSLSNPSDGQALKYNAQTQKWVNANMSSGHTYSTTEQVIGTWIDGKPIYEKTIYCTIASSGETNTPHGISNISQIVSIDAVTIKASNTNEDFRPIPFTYATGSTDSKWYAGITITKTNVYIEAGQSFGNRHTACYVILKYTKTTD